MSVLLIVHTYREGDSIRIISALSLTEKYKDRSEGISDQSVAKESAMIDVIESFKK